MIMLTLLATLAAGACSSPAVQTSEPPKPAESIDNLMIIADKTMASGDWDTALKLYRDAATTPGAGPDVMVRYGQVLFASGSYDYAAGAFADALARRPQDGNALRGLAISQLASGRLGEARKNLEQAVRENADVRAIRDLAVLRLFEGEPDEAGAIYQKALARWPQDLDLKLDFALSLALDGSCGDAVSEAGEATASPYARAQNVAMDALVLAVCGQDDPAREVASRVMNGAAVERLMQEAQAARNADGPAARAAAVGVVPVISQGGDVHGNTK